MYAKKKWQVLFAPFISLLLTVTPICYTYYHLSTRSIFNFLAADSMYYLLIANNYTKFGFPTSDGINTTNGFQPLWQLLLIVIFELFDLDHDRQLLVNFGLSAVFVAAAYSIFSYGFYVLFGLIPSLISTLTLFPGLYSLIFAPRSNYISEPGILYTITPWSAINGVESPLVLFMWSMLFLILVRNYAFIISANDWKSLRLPDYLPSAASWCFPAILLCRLEQGLILVAIAVSSLIIPSTSNLERIRGILTVLWPSILIGTAYVLFNLITVGVPLPISGVSKIGFSIHQNFIAVKDVLTGRNSLYWYLIAVRIYPLIFGGIAGCGLIATAAISMKNAAPSTSQVKLKTSIYLFICGFFLLMTVSFFLIFEDVWHQGYWYYYTLILMPEIIFALVVANWIQKEKNFQAPVFVVCMMVLLFRLPNEIHFMESTKANTLITGNYAEVANNLWIHKNEIREELLQHNPNAKIVEPLDGLFGYVLNLPSRAITGLVSSPAEVKRKKEVGFWLSAIEDGFNIVPNYGYLNVLETDHSPFSVVEEFRPKSSLVTFFLIKKK